MTHHQNLGQNHNVKMADKSFENVTQLKYLEVRCKIKIAFTKKLIAHTIQGMLADIQVRIFCLPIKTKRLMYTKL
jgi:hypothetical protein